MAEDRTIEIRITAKNMSDAELAKARQAIAGFKRDTEGASGASLGFGNALRSVNALLGPFGAALSIGAVVKFGQTLLNDADALVKLADKTGMSTDAVQRLKYIAEQSGNTLENLSGAVSQLQKRLGQGDDSIVAALKSLGIELDRFQQLSPDEQFMAIAREVAKIEDPTQRAAKATELFGKSGTEILPSLIAKVDELAGKAPVMSEKAVRAFDSIGDAISDLWARTKNAIGEGLAAMFDGYGRLASGMKALFAGDVSGALEIFTDLAQQELPKVANVANLVHPPLKAIALSTAEVEAIETKLEAQRKSGTEAAKRYAAEQEKVAQALEHLGFTTRAAVTDELKIYDALLKQLPTIAGVNQAQIAYLPTLEKMAAAAGRAGLTIPTLTAALEAAREVAARAGDGFIEWEQSLPTVPLGQLIDLTGTQTERLDEQAVQARLLTDAYHHFGQETPEELRRVADASAAAYQRMLDSGTATTQQLAAAYAQMIADQRAVSGALPQDWTTSIVPGIKAALGTLQTAISGTFAQMMLGAKSFKDGFLDIWSSLKASVLRIFAEIADSFISGLIKRMLSALAGNKQAFSGGFASLFSGMGGGSTGGGFNIGGLFNGGGQGVALGGAGGSMIGPEFGTGDMLRTGAGAGTNWGAMAGGGMMAVGGIAGYIQARQSGSKLGQTLSGATTGAGIGTMIMPGIGTAIGAGVGALAGFVSSLFGQSKEWKDTKSQRAAFEQSFGGVDAMMAKIGQAYATLGRSGTEAEAAIHRLWDAKNPEQLAAAIEAINTKLAESVAKEQELASAQEEVAAKAAEATVAMKAQFEDLQKEYDGLAQSIADEAPEEVMGVVEAQTRARMDAIKQEQDALQAKMAETQAQAKEDAESLADAAREAFREPIKAQIDWGDPPEWWWDATHGGVTLQGGSGSGGTEPPGYASGALITRPHLATVGEGGEPELIGPVGFMAEALAGALASFGVVSGRSADRIVVESHVHVHARSGRELAELITPELPEVLGSYELVKV